MNVAEEVLQAEQRIRPHIRETPLEYSPQLSIMTGGKVYLKLENWQHSGSFKVRGALSKLLTLSPEQRAQGVVAASSGNHGIAAAFGLQVLGSKGIIFVPEDASSAKVEAIRRYGAEVRFFGKDCLLAEEYARDYAQRHNMLYISPYNDSQVIGGQGTIAVELARQIEHADRVYVALGGGGLISGIAGYLKQVWPEVAVVGCSPANSPLMIEAVQAGQIVDRESLPTLSDGTAGGIEAGAITFPLCQQLVDDYAQVSEEAIREAMRLIIADHHMLIEGAAGVAVAALLQEKEQLAGQTAIVVLCGANISLETLRTVI
ncbi:threonine/serine dehydratase [Ktedonosporobacter rubrisoli]|uniref:threonine ammonia-lyase n=1 Tax=Ktedonosporobacter rubrisoli TaxID=2509675 RepID=A0A4P6JR04_KTERU|nr:threonine/serine dehydratase [Ktedonosporobacter rubrisoli]QBD77602.1 threonine/serine dehydratase [Ktedonosporobacter rubrisoli]